MYPSREGVGRITSESCSNSSTAPSGRTPSFNIYSIVYTLGAHLAINVNSPLEPFSIFSTISPFNSQPTKS